MLTSEETAVRNYLAPPRESPWSWREGGELIAWNDGPTIAFRFEIEAVLGRLAPHGLPPFGAVLWLLAACRDGEAGLQAMSELQSQYETLQRTLISTVMEDEFEFDCLFQITRLPAELRGSLDAKVTLAELVFEECSSRTTREVAVKIVAGLSHGLSQQIVGTRQDETRTRQHLFFELKALRNGLLRVTPEALRNRRRTGLDQTVLLTKIDLPSLPSVRDLLATLRDDAELSGLARLAQQLMVVTQLPRAVSDPDEMPIGGVSDITNRGDWDKLLLSELAHDDLTLMARLANNEALFLRRERPPKPPERCQEVLVDTGLRMWGVPRVFAAAVALAFAATADQRTQCRTWRLSDADKVEPVDLTTRAGLLELLASLEMSRHPGHALPAMLEASCGARGSRATDLDAVLITTEDVLADREFQRALAELPRLTLYLATVNRAGEFCLQVHSARGTKRLREATLPLEQLLEPRRPSVPLIDKQVDPNHPAILRMQPFPLRLAQGPLVNMFWPAPHHATFAITGNGCLLRWDKRGLGGELLSDQIPKGYLHWYGEPDRHGTTRAVIGNDCGPLFLITIDSNNRATQQQICEKRRYPIPSVVWHRDRLFLLESGFVELIDPASGTALSKERVHWNDGTLVGRFFKRNDRWRSLSHTGHQVVEQDLCGSVIDSSEVLTVLESSYHDGPLAYLRDGSLRTLDGTQTLIKTSYTPGATRVVIGSSADARRVLLAAPNSSRSPNGTRLGLLVSFSDKKVSSVGIDNDWRKLLEPEAAERLRSINVRSLFDSIAWQEGQLRLKSSRGKVLELINDSGSEICWRNSKNLKFSQALEFAPLKSPGDARYSLSVATFTDGSRCFLDSRGMLHCQSSDRSLPEFTLVLVEGKAAGWSADGHLFGRRYFVGHATPVSSTEFWGRIILPFLKRL
ncbi:MAG: hypothetical protein ACKV2Q_34800 [Planctomycetaceae bacterium]